MSGAIGRGAVARIHVARHQGERFPFLVVLARPPLEAVPAAATRPGAVAAKLTHDAGTHWPDAAGLALANATLAGGGAVLLGFATLADSLACKSRLDAQAKAGPA